MRIVFAIISISIATLPTLARAESPSLTMELLNQLETMQQELRELRGKLEEQQNALQVLSKRQETLFLNLDSRLNSVNIQATSSEAKTASSVPENFEQQTAPKKDNASNDTANSGSAVPKLPLRSNKRPSKLDQAKLDPAKKK